MGIDLTGQRVLVTGASSGIGAAAAPAFARAGAVVAVCARRLDRLDETATAIGDAGGQAHVFPADLSDLAGIEAFAARVEDALGGIDVLVNNAGAPRRRRMQAITVAEFDETMALNFEAPMRLTLALLPGMIERGHGCVVNVSSMGTRYIARGVGAYAAAKGALQYFTEALYFDLIGTGVTAKHFVPGSTATEFSTPREGNDPPFVQPPDAYLDPVDVGAALVALVGSDDFERFASDEHRAASHAKYGDLNAYLTAVHAKMADN